MITLRAAIAILILPFNVAVTVPALILSARHLPLARPGPLRAIAGALLVMLGAALAVWTITAFARIGRGTLAPWDPPERLVIVGPYRHVRNPMITGVVLILFGEAVLAGAWPLAAWALIFAALNALYLPLIEEPDLIERFGEPYRAYLRAVPRWRPRLRAWTGPGQPGAE